MSSSKLTCKGTLRQVFISVYNWRYIQLCWYFRPSFVNFCPSPLLSGLTLTPPSLPCVKKYTVYTYTYSEGEVWGTGPHINSRREVPFTGKLFTWRHCLRWVLSFYGYSILYRRAKKCITLTFSWALRSLIPLILLLKNGQGTIISSSHLIWNV